MIIDVNLLKFVGPCEVEEGEWLEIVVLWWWSISRECLSLIMHLPFVMVQLNSHLSICVMYDYVNKQNI
jgi:hypothetical protein